MISRINLVKNHIIIEIDGKKVLLDTGSQQSFGRAAKLEIKNEFGDDNEIETSRTFTLPDNYMGKNLDSIDKFVGTRLDALLGLDIISHYKLLIDFERMICDISLNPIQLDGVECALNDFMGYPLVLKAAIGGQERNLIIDTGAMISFLDPGVVRNKKIIREADDFHPLINHFTVKIYKAQLSIAGYEFGMEFGDMPSLPTMVAMFLRQGGISGFLGVDLFKNFKVVFDFPEEKITLKRI